MSKIALSPNSSGSGTLTLASTNSNTNRTITLPDTAGTLVVSDANGVVTAAGAFTVDAAAAINLDSGSGVISFKDGGTEFGKIYEDASNMYIKTGTADKDIILQGTDGSTATNALVIDMSAAGNAIFSASVTTGSRAAQGAGAITGANYAEIGPGFINICRDDGTTLNTMTFGKGNSVVGSIVTTGSGTAFNTSSDHRLKENVDYDWDATTRLKQLKPARFNFIVDADTTVDGFLAHEAQAVVPECVSGTHNGTKTLTNVVLSSGGIVLSGGIEQSDWTAGKSATTYPSDSTWAAEHVVADMQGIDQAKLVPLLVKTILELEARITALEA